MNKSEMDAFVSFFVENKMCKIEYIIQNTNIWIEYCIQSWYNQITKEIKHYLT